MNNFGVIGSLGFSANIAIFIDARPLDEWLIRGCPDFLDQERPGGHHRTN